MTTTLDANLLSDLDQIRSRYHVLRTIGHDGAAPVYATRAFDSDRHFLVQVIDRPVSGSARSGDLTLWQAHTMAAVDHPALLRIHAVHHLQDGAVAVAAERRRGWTLAERIETEGALEIEEAVTILRDLAEALVYLHGRGILHRSVGPQSVFLDRDARRARLAPFALRRAVPPAGVEQGPTGRSSTTFLDDLRGFGVAGEAMVLGRLQSSDEAVELAALDLQMERPEAPTWLCDALARCFEKRPRRAWRSAEELMAHLDPGAWVAPAVRETTIRRTRVVRALHSKLSAPAAPGGRAALGGAAIVLAIGLLGQMVENAETGATAAVESSAPHPAVSKGAARAPSRRPIPLGPPSVLTIEDLALESAGSDPVSNARLAPSSTATASGEAGADGRGPLLPTPSASGQEATSSPAPTHSTAPSRPASRSSGRRTPDLGGLVLLGEPVDR